MWKTTVAIIATGVSFLQALGPLSLAPMVGVMMEQYNSSLAAVIQFTGVTILVLGFSNFIWVPIQTAFGRRPVLLFSMTVCLASMIWRAEAKTYGSFMGACALNGIGAGPSEVYISMPILGILLTLTKSRLLNLKSSPMFIFCTSEEAGTRCILPPTLALLW